MEQRSHILKVSRLEGLTDGIFAIAMTILVLDLHLPEGIKIINLYSFLFTSIFIKLIMYVCSFIILGTLWIAMTFQTGFLERLNRSYLWIHVFYLMIICIVPFSASLVAAHPDNYVSISFYAINLLCASLTQFLIIYCAHYYQLNHEDYTNHIRRVSIQRVFVAPPFYIASLFLAKWSTSIAFFLLVAPIVVYMIPGKIDKYSN